ncbi:MAG TPA: twin-arginine translocation signal domain-containing protein [Kofleriaceae bacterium]|nr:twin-arginine translocation signal domain-containing protein [Kofleriaceae bacterium]
MKLTRRAFIAMLGAAAAMLGLPKPAPAKPPKPDPKPTLWIGHF